VALPSLIDFRGYAPTAAPLAPEKILSGEPKPTIDHRYSDPSQQFHCGVWASEPGSWRIRYTEHEFCYLLEGRVRLTADSGEVREFSAGDAFVIPAGFEGTWETLTACRKHYAIFEATQA
jgi:uncharacterized protein